MSTERSKSRSKTPADRSPRSPTRRYGMTVVFLAVFFAVIGVFYLGSALERYIWGVGEINLISSALFILGGLLTAFPEIITSLIGLAIIIVVHGINYLNFRKKNKREEYNLQLGSS